jgi:hypothetical protein
MQSRSLMFTLHTARALGVESTKGGSHCSKTGRSTDERRPIDQAGGSRTRRRKSLAVRPLSLRLAESCRSDPVFDRGCAISRRVFPSLAPALLGEARDLRGRGRDPDDSSAGSTASGVRREGATDAIPARRVAAAILFALLAPPPILSSTHAHNGWLGVTSADRTTLRRAWGTGIRRSITSKH